MTEFGARSPSRRRMSPRRRYRAERGPCAWLNDEGTDRRSREANNGPGTPERDGRDDQTRPSTKGKKRGYVQLHLDFGQAGFAGRKCQVCGMRFTPGCARDERLHRSFHRAHETHTVPFRAGKGDVLVHSDVTGVKIYQLGRPTNRVQELWTVMERDFDARLEVPSSPLQKSYIAVEKGHIVGCLVMEEIQSKRCWPEGGQKRILCGVLLLWVSFNFRRRSIATKLLDVGRRRFVFGYCVPKDQIAFYQPTADGHHFAQYYSQGSYPCY